MLNWGQGKVGAFDYRSGNSQGILIDVLGVNPVNKTRVSFAISDTQLNSYSNHM